MVPPLVKSNLQAQRQRRRDLIVFAAGCCISSFFWLLHDASVCLLNCSTAASSIAPFTMTQPVVTPPGFHPIHVYFGKMDHLIDPIPTTWWLESSPTHRAGQMWFSQHGQDISVIKALNFLRDGYFVDLAANDAVWASNTFGLEQNFGWKGICIEGNPIYWYRLSFRNCYVVGGLAGSVDGEEVNVTLGNRKESGPFGGLVGTGFDNKHVRAEAVEQRYTASLATILRTFHAPKVIDYLSLDVEGAETFIMRSFPWDEYTFRCLTIERPSDELKEMLGKAGYKHALDIARGDTLWLHSSFYDSGMANLQIHPEEIKEKTIKHFPSGVRSVAI
ncbi:hypothetical protein MPSEU_000646100 [Mayamaea pseudoterrestris]|nr:hypothetical protein MPSEU_000646100 [Mayamaea pseudoterrestris]